MVLLVGVAVRPPVPLAPLFLWTTGLSAVAGARIAAVGILTAEEAGTAV